MISQSFACSSSSFSESGGGSGMPRPISCLLAVVLNPSSNLDRHSRYPCHRRSGRLTLAVLFTRRPKREIVSELEVVLGFGADGRRINRFGLPVFPACAAPHIISGHGFLLVLETPVGVQFRRWNVVDGLPFCCAHLTGVSQAKHRTQRKMKSAASAREQLVVPAIIRDRELRSVDDDAAFEADDKEFHQRDLCGAITLLCFST